MSGPLPLFLQPPVFFLVLIALLAAAAVSFIKSLQQDLAARRTASEAEKARQSSQELERRIGERDRELAQAKEALDALGREASASSKESEVLRQEAQQLKAQITALKQEAAGNISMLQLELKEKKEQASGAEGLAEENARLKKEIDELEEKFSQLFEQFLEEQRKNSAKPAPSLPPPGPEPAGD
jgi:chromosome segregation ATPase